LQIKEFARAFFIFAKVMRKITIKLGTQKRNACRSLPVSTSFKAQPRTQAIFSHTLAHLVRGC
jgi:hypothetical protein